MHDFIDDSSFEISAAFRLARASWPRLRQSSTNGGTGSIGEKKIPGEAVASPGTISLPVGASRAAYGRARRARPAAAEAAAAEPGRRPSPGSPTVRAGLRRRSAAAAAAAAEAEAAEPRPPPKL